MYANLYTWNFAVKLEELNRGPQIAICLNSIVVVFMVHLLGCYEVVYSSEFMNVMATSP